MGEQRTQPARAVAVRVNVALIRLRRLRAIQAIRFAALAAGATVDLDIHPTVFFQGQLRVSVTPGSHSRLRIGAHTQVGELVQVNLRGGSLTIGEQTDVRRFTTFNIGGAITVGDRIVLSQGMYLHCAEAMSIGDDTIVGEYTTIADSRHLRTDVGEPIHHASTSSPVSIGRNVWFGGHVIVADGVTIGDQAVVGGNAVVTKDVEPWWLVGGIPAKPIRKLEPEDSFDPDEVAVRR